MSYRVCTIYKKIFYRIVSAKNMTQMSDFFRVLNNVRRDLTTMSSLKFLRATSLVRRDLRRDLEVMGRQTF